MIAHLNAAVLYTIAQAASPETELPSSTVDPTLVTPGPIGFGVILTVSVIAGLLIIDMARRVRRNTIRGQVRERLQQEAGAQGAGAQGAAEHGDTAQADGGAEGSRDA